METSSHNPSLFLYIVAACNDPDAVTGTVPFGYRSDGSADGLTGRWLELKGALAVRSIEAIEEQKGRLHVSGERLGLSPNSCSRRAQLPQGSGDTPCRF